MSADTPCVCGRWFVGQAGLKTHQGKMKCLGAGSSEPRVVQAEVIPVVVSNDDAFAKRRDERLQAALQLLTNLRLDKVALRMILPQPTPTTPLPLTYTWVDFRGLPTPGLP